MFDGSAFLFWSLIFQEVEYQADFQNSNKIVRSIHPDGIYSRLFYLFR